MLAPLPRAGLFELSTTAGFKIMQAGQALLAASKVAATQTIGTAPYPGSTRVYSRTAGALVPCSAELCRESTPIRPIIVPDGGGSVWPKGRINTTVQNSTASAEGGRVYYNSVGTACPLAG